MKIEGIKIKNYKFIKELEIEQMENACILIGRNSTGKTMILDAIMTAFGLKECIEKDFNELDNNIEITVKLSFSEEDLGLIHRLGQVSRYKRYELFYQDFCNKFPSAPTEKIGIVAMIIALIPFIKKILPKIYYIDNRRDIKEIQEDILQNGIREQTFSALKENRCMFDQTKCCNACFQCIGMIEKKPVGELSIFETEKLLEYKMLHAENETFMERLNQCFRKNTGLKDSLVNHMNVDLISMMQTEIVRYREGSEEYESIDNMSEGMKSIYILSLLEAYMQEQEKLPCILMMEDPELFLHPQLQKTASEILYRLSMKNQVVFSTHSPTMIFNFNKKQIKQVRLDESGHPTIREHNDIGRILNDLGFSANDLMNVSFVFIVEGRQDKNRLPLLLNKYYSEVYDETGQLASICDFPRWKFGGNGNILPYHIRGIAKYPWRRCW